MSIVMVSTEGDGVGSAAGSPKFASMAQMNEAIGTPQVHYVLNNFNV